MNEGEDDMEMPKISNRMVGRPEWIERVAQAASKEFGREVGPEEAARIHDQLRAIVRVAAEQRSKS